MRRFLFLSWVLGLIGCTGAELPRQDYFERTAAPILVSSCASGTSGCHRDDGTGTALGNLDVTSYERLALRQDLLRQYGSYPEPLLLVKATASRGLDAPYRDEFAPLEITHAGGAIFDVGSPAYLTLKRWLDAGATRDGIPATTGVPEATGECGHQLPSLVDPAAVDPADPAFAAFAPVQSYLVASCGQGSCHGGGRLDFQLTCGEGDQETRANYLVARAFVAASVDDSELLTRPLDPTQGGQAHGGGILFPTRDDAAYRLLRDWAAQTGPLPEGDKPESRRFFEERVMPVLLRRGCAAQACHSPLTPHGLKLRAGSYGFFSSIALAKNYAEARGFLALESPNPLASRIIAKNVLASRGGIWHRAGAVLESAGGGADALACPPYDPATATVLCTLVEWQRLERAALPAAERADLSPGATVPLVYVERPADAARFVDFADYRPGADLVRAEATLGAGARVESVAGRQSLLGGCPGVGAGRADVDVRGPEATPDGTRVVFALRVGPASGLDLYEVGVDGGGCRRLTSDGGAVGNGVTVESFDPYVLVDDAGVEWVIYASARGGAAGPTRTPKLFLPAADLWRQPLAGGPAERLTWVRGVERQPALMSHGQLILTAEKASPDFYQIAGRRLDWDLSDYHPLLGQREENYQGRGGYLPGDAPADAVLLPSIGYAQATESREALNGNFLVVLADAGARGEGGALGVFNRSIGPFELGRADRAFAQSLTVLAGPTGRAGEAAGAYRSPYPLPDGAVLASYAAGADVGAAAPIAYDLVAVEPRTGERRTLVAGPLSEVEAILVVARPPGKLFRRPASLVPPDAAQASAAEAVVHFLDLPLLATLLDANDRRGRDSAPLRAAARVRFFSQASPPAECTTPDAPACAARLAGPELVYDERVELGSAPIAADGSVYVKLPTGRPVLIELVGPSGEILFRQREELQFGPAEAINMGVPERVFGTTCAGCHGSVSGRELDVHIDLDAITTASVSQAREAGLRPLAPGP